MTRLLIPAALGAALLAAPLAVSAATYSARPIAPVAAKRIIASDISWTCAPEACRGSTQNSRPIVLCQGLAKKAGRLESFIVDGRALPVADLDKCNLAARDGGAEVIAPAN